MEILSKQQILERRKEIDPSSRAKLTTGHVFRTKSWADISPAKKLLEYSPDYK